MKAESAHSAGRVVSNAKAFTLTVANHCVVATRGKPTGDWRHCQNLL